ncbi:hypothetical protein DM860_003494 [Cuscuta australis]|uniref:Uncharacterized protein n=1 Tax=Cuscuta australis TaxID=267555 RepID=A0A328DG20_9ASTE|nr:hypothetical protein DM860_003494 [Cuscuta australis]
MAMEQWYEHWLMVEANLEISSLAQSILLPAQANICSKEHPKTIVLGLKSRLIMTLCCLISSSMASFPSILLMYSL